MVINGRAIGGDHPVYLIAEIGINHNGRLDTALVMIVAAAKAGADAVKVQIIDPDKSYTKASGSYAIFKKAQMPLDAWKRVAEKARELSIDIFATFTHPDDMKLADQFGFPAIKISSSNLTNFPLLKAAARSRKPLIVSTGLSYLSEVDEAIRYCAQQGAVDIGILHCTSLYPTAPEDAHLRAITTLHAAFPDYPIGFSDHTIGIHCLVAAVALGARIIEKHFTLDRLMEGPDHHFSATPEEFTMLAQAVRSVERALGSGKKWPVEKEIPEREKLRRTLVAGRDIREGEVLSVENVAAKRSSQPGELSLRFYEMILGRTCRRALCKDEPITLDAL